MTNLKNQTISLELALSVLNSMEIASHYNGSLQEQIRNADTVREKHNLEILQAKQQKYVNELKDFLIKNASTSSTEK